MAKKHNKPTKTCADCIHESACKLWTDGRYISDSSASKCPNHETVEESGAYLCGVLDERNRKKTNADRIRAMTDEELAMTMMCPNENGLAEIDCDKSDSRNCYECLLKWLQEEVEE